MHAQSVHQFRGGEWYYAKDVCPTDGINADKTEDIKRGSLSEMISLWGAKLANDMQ